MALYDDYRHRLARLFITANHLEHGSAVTHAVLSDACSCSLRTITSGLSCLKEAGVELNYDARRRTYAS